jgi:hypothetical protein
VPNYITGQEVEPPLNKDLSSSAIFHITKEISRREVEAHRSDIVGITASSPRFVDQNGVLEWVCDVRVGVRENQGLIKDVLIAQTAVGIVTDMNIPVLMSHDEAGRLAIISRAQVRLPDVYLRSYSYADLGFLFMVPADEQEDGTWEDGFGYTVSSPEGETGTASVWQWIQQVTSIDDLGDDLDLDDVTARWEEVQ